MAAPQPPASSAATVIGRFAPSPTGDLHLGNLRTALVAWLSVRSQGGTLLVRMEDLDGTASSTAHEAAQLRDLRALGLDWDGEVVRQSERFDRYHAAIRRLDEQGLTYECTCSRREIREAATAPHGDLPDGAYPGTCRNRSADERERRRQGRPAALRLRAPDEVLEVIDVVAGVHRGRLDDVVLRRNDGVPAYNLAVVVDDAAQGVTEVVRGDDLLSSTPRQVHLQRVLGLPTPTYVHVPLALGADGSRLAKRHGAVTLDQLRVEGHTSGEVLGMLAASLGLARPGERVGVDVLVDRYDPRALPRAPWIVEM